jgi:hypothetical protein
LEQTPHATILAFVTPCRIKRLSVKALIFGFDTDPSEGGVEVGNRVRWLQVLIILSAFFGVLAVQSTRSRQGVLTGASGLRTMT